MEDGPWALVDELYFGGRGGGGGGGGGLKIANFVHVWLPLGKQKLLL